MKNNIHTFFLQNVGAVMTGLVPVIHASELRQSHVNNYEFAFSSSPMRLFPGVDARDKRGHDGHRLPVMTVSG